MFPDNVNPSLHENVTLEPKEYHPFDDGEGLVLPLAGVGSAQITTSNIGNIKNITSAFCKITTTSKDSITVDRLK